jgi:hypothetical protein
MAAYMYTHILIENATSVCLLQTANLHFFASNGNSKQNFVFLGRQTINSNRTIAVSANVPIYDLFVGNQTVKGKMSLPNMMKASGDWECYSPLSIGGHVSDICKEPF